MKLLLLVLLVSIGVSLIESQVSLPPLPCFSSLPIGLNSILAILTTILNTLSSQNIPVCNLTNTTISCTNLTSIQGLPIILPLNEISDLAYFILTILNLPIPTNLSGILCLLFQVLLRKSNIDYQSLTCIAVSLISGNNLTPKILNLTSFFGSTTLPLPVLTGIPLPAAGATSCTTTITQLQCVIDFIKQYSQFCISNDCIKKILYQLLCALSNLIKSLLKTVGGDCETKLKGLLSQIQAITSCGDVTTCIDNNCTSILNQIFKVGLPVGK